MTEQVDDDLNYHVSRVGDNSWLVEHRDARVAIIEQVETVPDRYILKGRYRTNDGELCVIGYIITNLEGAPEQRFNSPQEAAEAAAFHHLNFSSHVRLNDFQKIIRGLNRVQDDIWAAASYNKIDNSDQECLLSVSKQIAYHRKFIVDVFDDRFHLNDVAGRPDEMKIIVSDS